MAHAKDLIMAVLRTRPLDYFSTSDVWDEMPEARSRSTIRKWLNKLCVEKLVFWTPAPAGQGKVWSTTAVSNPCPTQKSNAPKPSNGRRSILMCTPTTMAKQSLITAVETVVQEFIAGGKEFTAHDVTSEVRARVNDGRLTVDKAEVGVVHVNGGQEVAKIGHDEIKDIVHSMHHSGMMVGYNRIHTGSFFKYISQAAWDALQQPNTPGPAPAADPAAALPPAPVFVSPSAPSADPSGTPPSSGGSYDGTPTL